MKYIFIFTKKPREKINAIKILIIKREKRSCSVKSGFWTVALPSPNALSIKKNNIATFITATTPNSSGVNNLAKAIETNKFTKYCAYLKIVE